MERFKAGVTRVLTIDQVLYILIKGVLEPDIKHELYLAFAVFDTENRGFLEIDEIESIVTYYGDVFNKDEVREMMRDANVRGDGNVYYKDFIESIFSLAPELSDIKVEYLYTNPNEDPSVVPSEEEEEKDSSDKFDEKAQTVEIDEQLLLEEVQAEEEQALQTKEKSFSGEEQLTEEQNSVDRQEPSEQ
ncbi:Calmodulin [Eumeta japonica]|uniref:Calmodulin n=1 Tax=Eumeta variegata TaxID=151549 RepID=A0A4C1ULF5_EUMVA|nr:Calmodulin [Eumeta japonica]